MSKEGYRPTFELSPQENIVIPQHFFEFIDYLSSIKWMNPPHRRPDCLSDNTNFTYIIDDFYKRSKSVSGNGYGDRWQCVETEISSVMKSELGEKEFQKRKFAIRNQALYLASKHNLRDSFNDDVALYYFYKNYNKNSINFPYVESRWNIWCQGYGVAGERTSFNKTTFYCYKSLS